jgi:UDP-N-acetylglucosamine 4,6-dehydratase
VVGIRPGEKVHETLISADEARSTLEFDDRYILEPPLALWEDNNPNQLTGPRVARDFVLASSDERLLMNEAKMRELLA